jgi:hypothetical protein
MEHTYAHRARQIGEWAGLARPEKKKPRIAVIVPVDLETDFNRLAALLKRLKYPNYQVTLFARPGIAQNRLDKVSNAVKGHAVWIWNMSESPEKSCAGFLDATDADIVAALHEDALYADDYLDEVSMFFSIPDVDFLGKGCHFRLKENGQIELAGEEKENRMAREAPSASMAVRKSKLTPEIVSRLVTSKVFATPEDRIFSSYRYSFLELPSRNARTDSREWRLRPL